MVTDDYSVDLDTQLAVQEAVIYTLQERIAELELDDRGWEPLDYGDTRREFTRDYLKRIIYRSRLFFLSNPLVNRAVTLQSFYVWGQGITITATEPDTNRLIQKWLYNPRNRAEFTSHQARTMKEQDLQVQGNLFFVLFPDTDNETFYVRTIPVDEITQIITNPADRREPWYYKRSYTEYSFNIETGEVATSGQPRIAYYPDWLYKPESGLPKTIGGYPVMESPVYHVRVGGLSDQQFGIPETYQALDWVKAYRQFLEDWATIQRALARFAWHGKVEGGSSAVSAMREKLASKIGTTTPESNPPPAAGSTFVSTKNTDLIPLRTAGVSTGAEEGRRLLLMVCAATGFPETFYGDVSVGTLATAKSLDRPTELKFKDRQTLWADIIRDFLTFLFDVVDVGMEDRDVTVEFPPILEHDVNQTMDAIVTGATLDGKQPAGTIPPKKLAELILTTLGVQNVDEIVNEIDFTVEEDPETVESFAGVIRKLYTILERQAA